MNNLSLSQFKWDFPSQISQTEQGLQIQATPQSDYFVEPLDGKASLNAPFYHLELPAEQDFTLQAKIQPDFHTTYDAGALMLYQAPDCWVKFAFELTDLGFPALVSVVTNGRSDDANGPPSRKTPSTCKSPSKVS